MAAAFLIVELLLSAGIVFCAFMGFVRNPWVFAARMSVLRRDMDEYRRLPSYDAMMLRFWRWDVRDFLRERP